MMGNVGMVGVGGVSPMQGGMMNLNASYDANLVGGVGAFGGGVGLGLNQQTSLGGVGVAINGGIADGFALEGNQEIRIKLGNDDLELEIEHQDKILDAEQKRQVTAAEAEFVRIEKENLAQIEAKKLEIRLQKD